MPPKIEQTGKLYVDKTFEIRKFLGVLYVTDDLLLEHVLGYDLKTRNSIVAYNLDTYDIIQTVNEYVDPIRREKEIVVYKNLIAVVKRDEFDIWKSSRTGLTKLNVGGIQYSPNTKIYPTADYGFSFITTNGELALIDESLNIVTTGDKDNDMIFIPDTNIYTNHDSKSTSPNIYNIVIDGSLNRLPAITKPFDFHNGMPIYRCLKTMIPGKYTPQPYQQHDIYEAITLRREEIAYSAVTMLVTNMDLDHISFTDIGKSSTAVSVPIVLATGIPIHIGRKLAGVIQKTSFGIYDIELDKLYYYDNSTLDSDPSISVIDIRCNASRTAMIVYALKKGFEIQYILKPMQIATSTYISDMLSSFWKL